MQALATVSPQRAAFQVREGYADRLQTEQRVTFRVAALPGRQFIGTVDFIDPTVQLPGRTIMVKGQVANPKRELQSGFVEVKGGVESGETVVVGGQEPLAEGAPVAPKLIQRAPVPGGKESASVGAR
jgi:multidrug efflux pump subunit AcrA (membrane-fusion protein)